MNVKEFYESVGGDYNEAMSLLRKEERAAKYLGMFLRDDSFSILKEGMDNDDMELAFRGAHTLKGVAGNLCLARLKKLASDLTEDLRNGADIEHAKAAYPAVADCYKEVIDKIQEYTSE